MTASTISRVSTSSRRQPCGCQVLREPAWARLTLLTLALGFLFLFLFVPLLCVFVEAFRKGWHAYFDTFADRNSQAAIVLTLKVCAIAVPLNVIFGISAAWALTKFNFKGKNFLLTLIDLPFAISPVISGLVFILIFSHTAFGEFVKNPDLLAFNGTALGQWLAGHGIVLFHAGPFVDWVASLGINVVFNTPGLVLATLFVTFPFVARELIPLMQAQGADEEQAAISLGASGWKTFWRVTLPNIKWGLLHGVVLCNARAMGEFGAVSVVSGHIQGKTNTIPLHVEVLYESNLYAASFAMASLLTMLALLTLVVKVVVERKERG
ncbi:MAG: sulfate ABC transporter permease subunit CysW [Verrucomicrobiales bacterium]|jgi:sulfate transport system permease protein|nr:sulfate ABC transporter permease subunit CysW [Verrucomicrobiales bacterium]